MTAIPCGQKNRTSEMIQSQMVTPPLAAIDGTTLRLNTATTKRRTRSQRPSTRRRCGAAGEEARAAGEFAASGVVAVSFDNVGSPREAGKRKRKTIPGQSFAWASWGAACCAPTLTHVPALVAGGADFGCATLLLSFRQGRGDFFENGEMLVDIGFGV